MRKPIGAMATAAVLIALAAGCSNKPPVISRVYARVIYQHDTAGGAYTEGLSVFLVASDPDGMENLSSFYVINDEAELFWKVDSSSWVSSTAEGETWIGSNTLAMPGAARVPAGDYRVILQNSGGDTVEQTFSIPPRAVSAADASYATAAVAGTAIKVSGPYDSFEIWTYGKDGKFVASFPAAKKDLPLSAQKIAEASPALAQGYTFRVYANNARGGFAVVSGPYNVAAPPPPAVSGR